MGLLTHLLTPYAKNFIAGEKPEDGIKAVKTLNSKGLKATLDILGEDVKTKEEATRAADSYISLLDLISAEKVDSNVSLKLTQMGLKVDAGFCTKNLERILTIAKACDNFVRIDMEGSDCTQKTLDIFYSLRPFYNNVGVVIQAYLFRSSKDLTDLIAKGASVRLCKGAYKESKKIAFKKKKDVDANYVASMKRLLLANNYPAIATHDEKIIEETKKFAEDSQTGKESFEFQMLYGIRPKLQEQLVKDGYKMRVYTPFGSHWLPYTIRRLKERKENVFFVLKNLCKE